MAIYMNMVKPNHFIFAKYFRAANTLVVVFIHIINKFQKLTILGKFLFPIFRCGTHLTSSMQFNAPLPLPVFKQYTGI